MERNDEEVIEELMKVVREKDEELKFCNLVKESWKREVTQKKLVIRDQAERIGRQEPEIAVLRAENNELRLEVESMSSYLHFCRVKYWSLSLTAVPAFDKSKADNRMKGFFK
jgi:predicted RNase H-like nuclease (RuvC/YqgF family)